MKENSAALHYGRLVPVEHARQELCANIPAGVTLKEVLKPEFWKHYVQVITPNTILECMAEDGQWEASLKVMYVGETGVDTAVRWEQSYDVKERDSVSATHYIKWISPPKKYGVIHKDSGTVVQDGFYPKARAQKFLATL